MIDPFGRDISYLRVSVTDRCDFRCTYCMSEDMTFLPKKDVLSLEELERLCNVFVKLGVKKLRLTGGEPLVRKNIMSLIRNLGHHLDTGDLEELTLTTNGSQLHRYAAELFDCGVRRVNVSIDTLDSEKFTEITRWGKLENVLRGIEAAANSGLKIKLNTVALRGTNEDELPNMVKWAGERGFDITIIEVMPMGEIGEKRINQYMPLTEVKSLITTKYSLTKDSLRTAGPATYMHCVETDQKIGFITPMSNNFCATCNRIRISSTGKLYMCLGQNDFVDFREILRSDRGDDFIKEKIRFALSVKPKRHDFIINSETKPYINRHMNETGG